MLNPYLPYLDVAYLQPPTPRQMPYSFAVELQQSMGFVASRGGTAHVAPLLAVRDALAGQMWRFQWSDAAMTLGKRGRDGRK
jgi:hypothetical protein